MERARVIPSHHLTLVGSKHDMTAIAVNIPSRRRCAVALPRGVPGPQLN
jgi:hypothetical protein